MNQLKLIVMNFYKKNFQNEIYLELSQLIDNYFNLKPNDDEKIYQLIPKIELNSKKAMIMQKLLLIPFAKTMAYSSFAKFCNLEKQTRSIATLIGKNPLPIIIPCHRIVKKNAIGNYIFCEENKKLLINFEKTSIKNHA